MRQSFTHAPSPRAAARSTDRDDRPVVMHVIYALEHGGTERFLCRLLRRWANGPVRHVVCTLREAGERAATLPDDIEVVPLRLAQRDRLGWQKLARVIRSTGARVVHARNWSTWTDALLACRRTRGARLVLGFHGTQAAGGFTMRQRVRARMLGIHRQRFTTVSHAAAGVLTDTLRVARRRIDVLANGVDLDVFPPTHANLRREARQRWGFDESALVIGNVGNFFASVKGQDVLIEAFADVARRVPQARLALVGFGPRQDALWAQVKRYDLVDRVCFAGAVEHTSEILPAVDLYVCPSLAEGMSNALLEAAAMAIPCVSTDVADHARLLRPLDDHAIVPPGDVAALASAVCALLDQPVRRAALAANGRSTVEREYNFEQTQADYAAFYHRLVYPSSQPCPEAPAREAAAWAS